MGDRANIVINSDGGSEPRVYLYTHWGGYELPHFLQSALKRGKSRWNDEAYLTRIIFCEMIKGHEDELTGFGISTYMCDNGHPLLVVDSKTQQVWLEDEEGNSISAPISFKQIADTEEPISWDFLASQKTENQQA